MSESKNESGKKAPIEEIFRELAKREMTPNERRVLLLRPRKKKKIRKPRITKRK